MAVSKMIQKEGIRTIIVNTNPHFYGRETYGFTVTQFIATATRGTLHTLGRLADENQLVESIMSNIAQDQRMITHDPSSPPRLAD